MIFEVTPDHVERLGDADLRTLVGYLAEQEVTQHGHSAVGVTYGGHQNASDGGIDVRVQLLTVDIEGFVPRAETGFQVKAEDMARAAILKEMRPGGKLRASIADLAAKSGAYIIVSSKGSVADTSLAARRKAMTEAIADLEDGDKLYVDFYDRRRLATWVNQNPGLIPWVRSRVGLSLSGWQPFADWSSSPGPATEDYFGDDHLRLRGAKLSNDEGLSIEAGINVLRGILRQPLGAIRLVGLSGVGKTRFVQALFDQRIGEEALSPHVAIYTDLADEPDPIPLELLAHAQNLNQACVLIIDNCGIELHRKLVARMKVSSAPVSLVTIEYDISDDTPENTDIFKLEPASSEIIEKIVERRYPNLSQAEARAIANFAEGNFRIALALAATAEYGQSLASLNDNELFKRLFRQRNENNPALLRFAAVSSLVYSFDGETLEGDDAELAVLADLAGQPVSEAYSHAAELHRRQLIQKRAKWRAVLPHALAHRLAKQALQDIPDDTILSALTHGPVRLLKSFSRRIGCLHDAPEAQKIAAQWLAEDGWLSEVENFNELGQTLFDNIAPVDPEATLQCIEKAVERGPALFEKSDLNRNTFIHLLRALAYEPRHFDRALKIMIGFTGEGEPSNNSGEAINVFKSMFMITLSGTHAPATQRAAFLLHLAQSDSKRDVKLVLAGLDAMLEVSHFSSSYGFEFGARKRDFGFHPGSYDEVRDWFGTVFDLCQRLAALPHLRVEVRRMVASQLRFLVAKTGMIDGLVGLVDAFVQDRGWPEGWAGVLGAIRSVNKEKAQDDIATLELLAERLRPQSLADRITCYVTPQAWSSLDLAELDFDEEHDYTAAENEIGRICKAIGAEIAADLDLLEKHASQLAEAKSYRVSTVVSTIGEHVQDIDKAWQIIRETPPTNEGDDPYVIQAMFVNGLARQNRAAAEAILDAALQDEAQHKNLIPMQVGVTLNAAGIERIVAATKLPTVPTNALARLQYNVDWKALPAADFCRIVRAIIDRENGFEIAFGILEVFAHRDKSDKEPIDPTIREVAIELLSILPFDEKRRDNGHGIARVISTFLQPDDIAVARELCSKLLEAFATYAIYAGSYNDVVKALAAKFPTIVLDILLERAANAQDRGYLFLTSRIGKVNHAATIDPDTMFDWAEEKPASRYEALAYVVPIWEKVDGTAVEVTDFDEHSGALRWTETAKRLINSAPDPIVILDTLFKRFRPSGWSGSLATILESRLPLLEIMAGSDDPRLVDWARSAIPNYKKNIESQREWEARDSRERDERFEW